MRSCPRHIYIRMLRGLAHRNEDYTPFLYRPWVITTLIVLDVLLIIAQSVIE